VSKRGRVLLRLPAWSSTDRRQRGPPDARTAHGGDVRRTCRAGNSRTDNKKLRVVGRDTRWGAAAPLVEAFEQLRYGERDPDRGALACARAAFATVEAAVRT